MRHTRYGYWLEEAGPVEPTPAARGRHDGGRRHRRRRLPRPLDGVAAEGARARARRRRARGRARGARAERAQRRLRLDALGRPPDPARPRRRRPRGRGLPRLRARGPRDRSVVRRAGRRRVVPRRAARCRSRRARPARRLGRARRGVRGGRRARRGAAADARTRSRARCASPLFLGGAAPADGGERAAGAARARAPREGDRGGRPAPRADARCASSRRDGDRVDTATAHACAPAPRCSPSTAPPPGSRGYRLALAVASSHMVITEPVPDVIEEIGWTGGENIHDCRTLLHYLRTTQDGRIALGWGGGRMGFGGRHRDRLDIDPRAAAPRGRGAPLGSSRSSPAARSPTPGAARSTSRPRTCRSSARAGASTTASASPATASARPTSAARSSRGSRSTGATRSRGSRSSSPTASSSRPSRCASSAAPRSARRSSVATTRTTAATTPDPLTGFVASLPRRLGLRLPR